MSITIVPRVPVCVQMSEVSTHRRRWFVRCLQNLHKRSTSILNVNFQLLIRFWLGFASRRRSNRTPMQHRAIRIFLLFAIFVWFCSIQFYWYANWPILYAVHLAGAACDEINNNNNGEERTKHKICWWEIKLRILKYIFLPFFLYQHFQMLHLFWSCNRLSSTWFVGMFLTQMSALTVSPDPIDGHTTHIQSICSNRSQ